MLRPAPALVPQALVQALRPAPGQEGRRRPSCTTRARACGPGPARERVLYQSARCHAHL